MSLANMPSNKMEDCCYLTPEDISVPPSPSLPLQWGWVENWKGQNEKTEISSRRWASFLSQCPLPVVLRFGAGFGARICAPCAHYKREKIARKITPEV